jgi:copper homeostasis protein (lipoprotein)
MALKYHIFSALALSAVLTACNGTGTEHGHDSTAMDHSMHATTDTSVSKAAAAPSNTLSIESYSGIVPCADCEGIETSVTLKSDSSYVLHLLYIGRKSKGPGSNEFSEEGKWMKHGPDMIHLTGVKNGPSMYIRTDSSLIQLDMKGERITGKLAAKYELKNKVETTSNH